LTEIIRLKNLTKKYKNLVAVDSLDLTVYKGDVFGFLGPNGAGKSTTIRMLLSLIKPTSGHIFLFGKSLKENRLEVLKKIGAIVEKPDFYLYLNAYKNLEILGKISGADVSKKNIMSVLELVGLEKRANSKVKTFSHGMKQRLGIAQALLHDPELIILDEPTTGLDPQGIKEIRELIGFLSKEKNKTVLLSSHILKEIELVCNRMIIINKGKTQVEGFVETLLKEDELLVSFDVSNYSKAVTMIKESEWSLKFKRVEKNKLIFSIEKENVSRLNKFFVENNFDVNAIVHRKSLEEYFLKITGGGEQ